MGSTNLTSPRSSRISVPSWILDRAPIAALNRNSGCGLCGVAPPDHVYFSLQYSDFKYRMTAFCFCELWYFVMELKLARLYPRKKFKMGHSFRDEIAQAGPAEEEGRGVRVSPVSAKVA